ncbi:GNAT family N-acetyltransferase, partial [Corynebacterium variabile]
VATQPFYASYGFEPVGEPFTVEGIEHQEMHLTL